MALLPYKTFQVSCRSDSWLTSFSSYISELRVTDFFPASIKLFLSQNLLLPDLFHSRTKAPSISSSLLSLKQTHKHLCIFKEFSSLISKRKQSFITVNSHEKLTNSCFQKHQTHLFQDLSTSSHSPFPTPSLDILKGFSLFPSRESPPTTLSGLLLNQAEGLWLLRHIHYSCFLFILFYLFLVALGLRCCARSLSSCSERGLLFIAVRGLLIVVAALVAEPWLQAHGLQQLWHAASVVVARGLQSAGSVVAAHGLSCSVACGIFPDQGSNPCPLHWQAYS